jgi:hypothetical protein
MLYINFEKMGWAIFWVIISQSHLVTLAQFKEFKSAIFPLQASAGPLHNFLFIKQLCHRYSSGWFRRY